MDIPNLAPSNQPASLANRHRSYLVYLVTIILAITAGFWLSRLSPSSNLTTDSNQSSSSLDTVSVEEISDKSDIKVGVVYGQGSTNFKDSATGIIKKGGINGEGTHTLERPGGATQHAALTSSALDLDLFIDRQVEVNGETNTSNKSGWFLDVGSIKVLQ